MVPNIQTPTRAGIAVNHANPKQSPFIKATKTVGLIALGCLAIYALSLKYVVLISAVCIASYGIYAGAHSLFGENKILGPAAVNRVANRMLSHRPNPRLRAQVYQNSSHRGTQVRPNPRLREQAPKNRPVNGNIQLNRPNPRLKAQVYSNPRNGGTAANPRPQVRPNPNTSNLRPNKPNNPRGAGQSCQVVGKRPHNPNPVRGGKSCNKHTPPKKVSFVKGDIAGRFYPTHNAENKSSVDKQEGKTTGKKPEGKS